MDKKIRLLTQQVSELKKDNDYHNTAYHDAYNLLSRIKNMAESSPINLHIAVKSAIEAWLEVDQGKYVDWTNSRNELLRKHIRDRKRDR